MPLIQPGIVLGIKQMVNRYLSFAIWVDEGQQGSKEAAPRGPGLVLPKASTEWPFLVTHHCTGSRCCAAPETGFGELYSCQSSEILTNYRNRKD